MEKLFSPLEGFEWSLPFLGWFGLVIALLASVHVILRKRDSRSAIGWIGLIWLSPFVGAFVYSVLGVNRIQKRAQAMRPREGLPLRESLGENVGVESATLLKLGDFVTRTPALPGNSLRPLINGEEAYPAMLRAIASARFSITLSTYIFDVDPTGLAFADALEAAHRRGVQVRVLIDDIGSRYSFRKMHRVLKKRGVPVGRFLPLFRPNSFFFVNLRLHRKILVVDGMKAFTGGMNIREAHCLAAHPTSGVQDTHFEIDGPVVRDIQSVFASDWAFSTGEWLRGSNWFPPLSEQGPVLSRCVDDGPDYHIDNAQWILLGAIASAQERLRIVTPYFVPDATLITALSTAALRGVKVEILLPQKNNLPWVQWATQATIGQLLEKGCTIGFTPPPFDHSKLMTVDGRWAFIGSVNWDARSLRLNFELNVEAYDTAFVQQIDTLIDKKAEPAVWTSERQNAERRFPIRLRDGFARLFSPYL
jgi:cardiolipin synthase A/B